MKLVDSDDAFDWFDGFRYDSESDFERALHFVT